MHIDTDTHTEWIVLTMGMYNMQFNTQHAVYVRIYGQIVHMVECIIRMSMVIIFLRKGTH